MLNISLNFIDNPICIFLGWALCPNAIIYIVLRWVLWKRHWIIKFIRLSSKRKQPSRLPTDQIKIAPSKIVNMAIKLTQNKCISLHVVYFESFYEFDWTFLHFFFFCEFQQTFRCTRPILTFIQFDYESQQSWRSTKLCVFDI